MDAVRLRHRRRALRRLLLPLPGGRPGLRRRRRTYAQYGAGFPTLADWRRDNIDLLISELDARDQGGQAVGEVRHQPVRRCGATRPPTRAARTRRPACRPTTTCTRTPASGSARSGSTTSCRRSTGTSASPPPTTTSSCRGGRTRSAAPTCTSTSARRRTRSARRRSRRTGCDPAELSDHLAFDRDDPRGQGRHLLLRQGRARRPARRHGDRRARPVPPPRAGAADAVDRRVGTEGAQGPSASVAGRGRPSGGGRVTPRPSRTRCTGSP